MVAVVDGELLQALLDATETSEVASALEAFEASFERGGLIWAPVGGRENNRGTIEVARDPGRSLVERLTNSIDAILELEHDKHNGMPDCRSPKDAATAWLNIPQAGLSELTPVTRRELAQKVTITLSEGDGRNSRTVEVRDSGTGILPDQMSDTILSLNATNKLQKHYVAGIYGQGGSSTFASSKYTLIASRYSTSPVVGFTVIRYIDLPPEEYKTGYYGYLAANKSVFQVNMPEEKFPAGTLVKHFGYDLSDYASPVGPSSVYGLLNRILFDPILPVWLDSRVHRYRRVIKGSRNALNGAIDEGDESRRGPSLSHRMPMFYADLGDYGRIGIEYWVLERPAESKNPIAAFVHPNRPVILSLNGQNQGELSRNLVKQEADLPYLVQRLVCHVNCDALSPAAKRYLFVSNREEARHGVVYDLIKKEIVRALKSDDEMNRLNNEARDEGLRERDDAAKRELRREVVRLLRIYGAETSSEPVGGKPAKTGGEQERPSRPHPHKLRLQPLDTHEPPTYIRIVWDPNEPFTFYPGQRRYLRIETDANSSYHNPNSPSTSRINLIISEGLVDLRGSSPLVGGRMRAILEATAAAIVDSTGTLRVELTRPGLPTLHDECSFRIIETPPVQSASRQVSAPDFEIQPISGPEHPKWASLGWPDDIASVASEAIPENGKIMIYYSESFPFYASQRSSLERRDLSLAKSFTSRYEIWLIVHSLLLREQQEQSQKADLASSELTTDSDEQGGLEEKERQERCRVAKLAAMMAAREIRLQKGTPDVDEG